jgi:3-oxoacyl-[acyl-carrier protein] reductase
MDLKGKTALITGGSRGIGRAIAINFAKNGADIAITYSGNETKANETAEIASAFGVRAKCFKCDASDFIAAKETVRQVLEHFGSIDILVNNAGITADKLLLTMTEDDFDKVVDVNLKGAFNFIKHTCQHFFKKRSGKIINITSVSGLSGNAGQINYSSSKAGLIGLTKSVAKEFAARNINCNAIAPGFISTDMTDVLSEQTKKLAMENIPLKRMGTADEIAALALFLASDLSDYITGEIIKVDGGLYI